MAAAQPNPVPRDQAAAIRALFVAEGPMPIDDLADLGIERGLFEGDRFAALRVVARRKCRDALKLLDEHDLPFAGPSSEQDGDRNRIWKQRTFWDFADYEFNIGERAANDVLANAFLVVRLNDECDQRYGRRVTLPPIDNWH